MTVLKRGEGCCEVCREIIVQGKGEGKEGKEEETMQDRNYGIRQDEMVQDKTIKQVD